MGMACTNMGMGRLGLGRIRAGWAWLFSPVRHGRLFRAVRWGWFCGAVRWGWPALGMLLIGVEGSLAQDVTPEQEQNWWTPDFDVHAEDAIWTLLEIGSDTGYPVNPDDEPRLIEMFNEGVVLLNDYVAVRDDSDLDPDSALVLQLEIIEQAIGTFESGLRIYPFDVETRRVLGQQIYPLQFALLNRMQRGEDIPGVLEKLVLLLPADYGLREQLGVSYYNIGAWEQAAASYAQAGEILLAVRASESDTSVAVDSLLFTYDFSRGRAFVEARDVPSAQEAFARALEWARTEDERQEMMGWLDWVGWDGGNLEARIRMDSLLVLEREGSFAAAESGYQALLPDVRNPETQREIKYRLVMMAVYQEREAVATERLRLIVKPFMELASPDSASYRTYQVYLEDYGTLCYNLANEYYGTDLQRSHAYFTQAAHVPWSGQARAYLRVAYMLESNLPEAIRYAEAGLLAQPDETIEADLHELLAVLYRRAGRFDEAYDHSVRP